MLKTRQIKTKKSVDIWRQARTIADMVQRIALAQRNKAIAVLDSVSNHLYLQLKGRNAKLYPGIRDAFLLVCRLQAELEIEASQ